jgi:hypothetical protein
MNDLIGLQYAWGHRPLDGSGFTDCFQLSCEVRRRLGLNDHAAAYAWVYKKYNEASFTAQRLARFLLTSGVRTLQPITGDMILLSGGEAAYLGTLTNYGTIFISPGEARGA